MLDDVDHTCSAEMTAGITERPTYLDCHDEAVPTVSECLIKDSTRPLAPPRPSCRAIATNTSLPSAHVYSYVTAVEESLIYLLASSTHRASVRNSHTRGDR